MTETMRVVRALVEKLNRYRDAYYNHNESLITDQEYDALYDKLLSLEEETGIILSDSPTQNVGFTSISKLNKVTHNHPLLSLGKTTDISEFKDYFGKRDVVLMAKLDGLTCSLLYKDGKLVRAESRGDGEVGEDITNNAFAFSGFPLTIPYQGELIVDGECIITKDEFERIKERESTEYKNPRNLVSGTVRQLSNEIVKNRHVRFIAWKLYSIDEKPGCNSECFARLAELGFDVVPYIKTWNNENYENFENAVEYISVVCEEKHIPIDGIVGMFDDIQYGESLGMTAHHPRHSLAYKFYQDDNETTLLDIEWATSRTGLINPVAVFGPVEIDGTTVSRATLNNVSIIKELELGIGDTITVIKSNQIIPKVTQNLTRSGTYGLPTVCPCCGQAVEIRNENGREMMYCVNKECPSIMLDRIANFVSRDGLNIIGLSDERIRSLMDNSFVKWERDLFCLKEHRAEIVKLPGWGESSFDNLMESIEKGRHCRISNAIVAIGIPGIGKTAAKMIEKHLASLDKTHPYNGFDLFLHSAMHDYDWSVIPGIGEPTSNAINRFVQENDSNLYDIAAELIIDSADAGKELKSVLSGKSFCITGKLIYFASRNDLVSDIESKGGTVTAGVTAKTDYLITNDKNSGSSKNKAAEKFGTKIISEEEYLNMQAESR